MSVHTRRRHIKSATTKSTSKQRSQKRAAAKTKKKSIPWREAAKDEIEKYSEGGLMLRGSRFKEEITQENLAKALGISQHHISEMEHGKRPIGKEMAKRFAEFFKTDYRIFL
jgi:ribosome-binding protein aMBF1 (putative translation factor)